MTQGDNRNINQTKFELDSTDGRLRIYLSPYYKSKFLALKNRLNIELSRNVIYRLIEFPFLSSAEDIAFLRRQLIFRFHKGINYSYLTQLILLRTAIDVLIKKIE